MLLSAAAFMKGQPALPRPSRVLRSRQLFSSALCKASALPKSSPCQPVHSCCLRGNQNEGAIADTAQCRPRKMGPWGPPGLSHCLWCPCVLSLQWYTGTFRSTLTRHAFHTALELFFAICFSVLKPTAVALSIISHFSQLPLKTESRPIRKPRLSQG